MEDIEHLPKELQIKPRCLIALTGLNVETNQFHAHVWKSFSRGQPDDHDALRFINLPLDHSYSKAKPKHSSHYEWYQVEGIIKRHWMKKHLEELPAVVIVFFDLENNDPLWSEKVKECARRVDLVRSNIITRATKLVITLLQTQPTNAVSGDINSATRIQELAENCQINIKNIYLLQQFEFMLSSVKSLEAELFGMAYNYYHNAAKRVKGHKSSLTKANQQLLYVRHDFKIAFFNELKQDSTLALKHYRQAYNSLVELKTSDANLLEVKVVAGFINFKICQITFQMHGWDAISQFRRHIEIFKNAVGMTELAYEHEAWLSKQYEIFGKLFEEAIQINFQASISRHPGLYYHEAGRHTANRRNIAVKLCHGNSLPLIGSFPLPPSPSLPSSGPGNAARVGESLNKALCEMTTSVDLFDKLPEFFGQRPWRNAGQTLETSDPIKEREGIAALQAKEVLVDHSRIVIPLFARASLYFERYGAKRMRSYPTYYIAEEFFRKGEFESALENYNKIVDDFRRSGWATLFAPVRHRMYQCATLLGKNSLVISTAMELLSNVSVLPPAEKEKIHELVFSTSPNFSTLRFDSNLTEIIDLTNLKSCVEVKAQFTKTSFTVDEPVKLIVFLKSFTQFPLRFNGISVRLNHETLQDGPITLRSSASAVNHSATTSSSSICKWEQVFDLTSEEHLRAVVFTLDPTTLGSAVQVETIELGLFYANQSFYLRWFPSSSTLSASDHQPLEIVACNYTSRLEEIKSHLANSSAADGEVGVILNSNLTPVWEFFNNRLSTEVLPKTSNLEMSLRHTPPVLCNEKYTILCQILNTEATDVTDLNVSAMLAGGGANDAVVEPTSTAPDTPHRLGSVAVGQKAGRKLNPASSSGDELFSQAYIACHIPKGVDLVCPIFVHCPKVAGDRSLRVDAHYNILTHLPTPGVKVISWRSNGSISILFNERVTQTSSDLTLTRCIQSKRVQLSVIPPFDMTSRLLSLKHEVITTAVTGKPFILEVSLTNSSPWPIDVENSLFNLGPGVRFKGSCDPFTGIVSLDPYENLTEVQVVVMPENPSGKELLELGQYIAHWRRRRPQSRQDPIFPKSSLTTSVFNLPTCCLTTLPYTIDLNVPPIGLLHVPFTISCILENKTTLPQELNLQLESTEGFLFCGVQLASLRLLPNDSRKLDFTLLPLRPGYLQLPKFNLWTGSKASLNADEVLPTLDGSVMQDEIPKRHLLKQLQSHVFIMPNREETLTAS